METNNQAAAAKFCRTLCCNAVLAGDCESGWADVCRTCAKQQVLSLANVEEVAQGDP